MSHQKKIIGAMSPTFFRLENSPHRLLWLAHKTSWMAPEWILPWGEGPAPEVPHVSGRITTYLQAMGLKEQYRMLDQARREVNDCCIDLIKKDVEHRTGIESDNSAWGPAWMPLWKEPPAESDPKLREWNKKRINMGFMRYLFQRHAKEVAAELSREVKMELMQEMQRKHEWGMFEIKHRRSGGYKPSIFEAPDTTKKFSKYFHFLATF